MYPFERCMKVIKGHVRNRNRPGGCIAEENVAEETIEFLSSFRKDMFTVGIPANMRDNFESTNRTANKDGFPKSAGKPVEDVSPEQFARAHFYVLQNTPEVDPYIK